VFPFSILVTLGKTKVNYVDIVLGSLSATDQEVIWLDVPMDDALLMSLLNSLEHLNGDHVAGLQIKLPLARLEQIFKGRTQHVHDHHVVRLVSNAVVCAYVVQAGDHGLTSQLVNEFALPEQHHVLLKLGCFFL
jgi:hypothetical protein